VHVAHSALRVGTEANRETTMKTAIFVLAMACATMAIGTSAQAQNYPWCAYWHGTGGARNCGFVSFAQCQLTAQGAGADCRANTQYEPNKPMR
jgi:hypothetical protein